MKFSNEQINDYYNNKTVAVTGGCGFIGSHMVRRLLNLGVKKLVVIDSLEFGKRENIDIIDPRIKLLIFKIGQDSIDTLETELKECEVLFHLAAQKHNQSLKYPHEVYDSNIIGTSDLFDLAGRCGVKKVIFSSSLYAYGSLSAPAMVETDLPTPKTIYGISKLTGEHLLRFFGEKYNFDFVSFRLFFVYGPKQYPGLGYKSVIIKNFERIIRGDAPVIYGDGKQSLDYIYVDDVIDSLIFGAVSNVKIDVINIGSGRPITILELTKLMSEVSGSALEPIYNDADWTNGSVRFADISKINKCFDWSPKVSLKDGLTETFKWLKSK